MNEQSDSETKARLVAVPSNPIPEDGRVGFVDTPDGARLRYARWQSTLRPTKGTVIILQGRAENIEKYLETVSDLRERGFGVLCFDWRGQGLSSRLLKDRLKGHIEHFDQYLTDLDTILSEIALPDCSGPFYLLGHSTGGLIAMLAAPFLGNRVRRMVLISPLFALRNLPVSQSLVQRVGAVLTFFGLGRLSVGWGGRALQNHQFIGNRLTSDTTRFQRNAEILATDQELRLSSPTVSWIFSACRAMEQVNDSEFLGTITIPTLMVAAGNDPIVSPEHVEMLGHRMRSGAHLTIFGAKHELLQERNVFREQLLSAFDAFVPGTEV